ncbi:MAG: DUF6250 domain-containing protein [Prevotella sp.]|nr:DUF6250 domain-containing protein [Prevotella sp.]
MRKTTLFLLQHVAFIALPLFVFAGRASAQSALDARQFSKYWKVESESPDYRVSFSGDTCELVAPQGLTLWRQQKMHADCAVEYDVQVMSDRLSDMNCFWLASDPEASTIWSRMKWRSGSFVRCYTLQMYYLGYGGNHNTTTRFRRYTGDARGVDSVSHRPAILTEYTDASHLLKPDHWYHVKLQTQGGRTTMWVDGQRIVSYLDPEPLTEGWFGFRTTLSHTRITNFQCYPLAHASLATGIPLHWIGTDTLSHYTIPVTLGIPFSQGELADVSLLQVGDYPTEAWVNASWPDGSVKWAGLSATVPSGKELCVTKKTRKEKALPSSMVRETAQEYIINSHVVCVHIPRQGANIIDSIMMDNKRLAGATRLIASTADDSFTGRIDSVAIERTGQQLTIARIEGRHCSDRRAWLPFVVRLYIYNNSRQVKLVHTFTYDGDEHRDMITSLGVTIGVPMRQEPYNRHIAFATDQRGVWAEPVQPLVGRRFLSNWQAQRWQMEGRSIPAYETMNRSDKQLVDNWAAWDGFRLSQLTDNSFSIRKRATAASPWIGTFTGCRAPGYVFAGDTKGGLGVFMHDFWQSYPSTIQIEHARSQEALLTMFLWSAEAEPMNLCHYDTIAHDLNASYEDVQQGLSTPYGIARTTTLWLDPQPGYPGKDHVCRQARQFAANVRLLPTPEYLHQQRAFGLWSLPDTGRVERRLQQYLDFYRNAIDQHKWYGFWNYGDMMHAYDPVRHEWQYDVGGYAWDNTELGTPLWLWYSFLRTGDADVWRMAEAMTRHNAEVDTYHLGPLAPLGSRHNVCHWGCGAKEARISQSAFLRFYYYLTGGDERTGDLMHAQTEADTLLYHLDPMRLAEPRDKYPCSAPARLRFGPDWLAYAGNWLTEWERTGNQKYYDKILTGMESITQLKNGLFTGNLAWGYDPATGRISYDGPEDRQHTNHLATIMGGFEVMNEILSLSPSTYHASKEYKARAASVYDAFTPLWLDYALRYKQMARSVRGNSFPVRRLLAYGAWQTRSPQLTSQAWKDLWGRIEHAVAPDFHIDRIEPPQVPASVDEWIGLSTNDAAMWSLDAIYMLETLTAQ